MSTKAISMSRILLIVPYFGRWPFWFEFFVLSCRHNPSINWLIICDSPPPQNSPGNVMFRQMSYDDYLSYASERLGVHFAPERPYKLCDLRPAFGVVHDMDLVGFDFWGFCDLDVVFGDLRSFLTPSVLENDVISSHATRISGHFSIFRNSTKIRDAFRTIPDWERRLVDQRNQRLDESAFTKLFLRHKNWPEAFRKWIPGANPMGLPCMFKEQYSTPDCKMPWVDGTRNYPTEWYWTKGALTNNRSSRTFMYFHFLHWKQKSWKPDYKLPGGHLSLGEAACFSPGNDCSFFRIDRKGFHAE